MKRFILIAAALVAAASSAKADETSESILRHIAETFASYGNYEVRFTVSAQGMGNMSGNYFVSGDRYRIKLQKQEQFSDGTNRYEIYAADKEVVIDAADTGSHNILNNPTRAFEFAPEEFESTYTGPAELKRKAVEKGKLVPRSDRYGNGTITLYGSAEDGMPVALNSDYQGEELTVTIDRIIPLEEIDKTMFLFDPSLYGDYEVIDFR